MSMSFVDNKAEQIAAKYIGSEPLDISRFGTGRSNFVYLVRANENSEIVIRINSSEQKYKLEGYLYWDKYIKKLGILSPRVYKSDVFGVEFGVPFIIMERLPGTDMVNVYSKLSASVKYRLAEIFVEIQDKLQTLPMATGYGGVLSYTDVQYWKTWRDVVVGNINEAKQHIRQSGQVSIDPKRLDALVNNSNALNSYFGSVLPSGFHEDLTHKNFLVHEESFSGILDYDEIAFGDVLFAVARTRVGLRVQGLDIDYTESICQKMNISVIQDIALDLYTAVVAANKLGHILSKEKDKHSPFLKNGIKQYIEVFDTYADSFNQKLRSAVRSRQLEL